MPKALGFVNILTYIIVLDTVGWYFLPSYVSERISTISGKDAPIGPYKDPPQEQDDRVTSQVEGRVCGGCAEGVRRKHA